jgi:hypothetical protein
MSGVEFTMCLVSAHVVPSVLMQPATPHPGHGMRLSQVAIFNILDSVGVRIWSNPGLF